MTRKLTTLVLSTGGCYCPYYWTAHVYDVHPFFQGHHAERPISRIWTHQKARNLLRYVGEKFGKIPSTEVTTFLERWEIWHEDCLSYDQLCVDLHRLLRYSGKAKSVDLSETCNIDGFKLIGATWSN